MFHKVRAGTFIALSAAMLVLSACSSEIADGVGPSNQAHPAIALPAAPLQVAGADSPTDLLREQAAARMLRLTGEKSRDSRAELLEEQATARQQRTSTVTGPTPHSAPNFPSDKQEIMRFQ